MQLKPTIASGIRNLIFDFGGVLLDIDIPLSVDAFRALIEEKKLFEHVEISAQRAEDVLFADEATLDFGLDWLELVIFGRCPGLSARGR